MGKRSAARTAAIAGAVAAGASVLGTAMGGMGAAAYFARRVLTPDAEQLDDVVILRHDDSTVTFATGPDPVVPGRYGVWLDGGEGHIRVGDILEQDATSVTRQLLAVDRGTLRPGPARWNQYYWWDRPSISMGIPDEDAVVISDIGPLPGWIVRPEPGTDNGDWAVLVHGRGARKEETLRAVPILRAAGYTCLIIAYRNDRDAPKASGGRYSLGLEEWRDVDAAMTYAAARGADRILLCGWSMGGAIVLQTLANSPQVSRVSGVMLDSAVIDWSAVLRGLAKQNKAPMWLATLSRRLMAAKPAARTIGIDAPLDLALTDWNQRAEELRRPLLIMHSDGDTLVPIGPAVALAQARPDLVTFERWEQARHCRLWNNDSPRWERALTDFVSALDRPAADDRSVSLKE